MGAARRSFTHPWTSTTPDPGAKIDVRTGNVPLVGDKQPSTTEPGAKQKPSFFDRVFVHVVTVNRVLTGFGYPLVFLIQAMNYWSPSAANARLYWQLMLAIWIFVSSVFYGATVFTGAFSSSWPLLGKLLLHFLWFWMVDVVLFWMVVAGRCVEHALNLPRGKRRLVGSEKPAFFGNRIVILGNGPSLAAGEPLGDLIDSMDEVVRFNNFQTKTSGLEAWTGAKTTVHFSDSMLYPTYPEYAVPGASVILSLFMDRLMVAGSYFIFRISADLAIRETWRLFNDPSLSWIPHEDITWLKEKLNISHWKHPTSGCLAIAWFAKHRPDKSVPIYIHGFDFFEGDKVHYYDKTEPFYERLNDRVGVTVMHQPQKEKAFVAELVKQGQVRWLRDLAGDLVAAELPFKSAADDGTEFSAKDVPQDRPAGA